jgi:hypothetical protein
MGCVNGCHAGALRSAERGGQTDSATAGITLETFRYFALRRLGDSVLLPLIQDCHGVLQRMMRSMCAFVHPTFCMRRGRGQQQQAGDHYHTHEEAAEV